MPTGADGTPTSPWGAPTAPPARAPVAEIETWDDHLPGLGPGIDPEPTGEIPLIPVVPPMSVGRRRARQGAAIAAGLVVPGVLFVLGISLIVAGIGFRWIPRSSSPDAAPLVSPELPVATAAVVVVGDPAVAATDTAALFASLLQARRFDEAAAMTSGVWTSGFIATGYGGFDPLQTVVARIAPVGPDEYRIRVVVFSIPADPAAAVVARCEQWSVNPTVPRVIPGSRTVALQDDPMLLLRGPELTGRLAETCARWPMG